MKQLPYLSKEFIDRATAIFGPAPILSSEAPESFDLLFELLASCLQARDFFELMLISALRRRSLEGQPCDPPRHSRH